MMNKKLLIWIFVSFFLVSSFVSATAWELDSVSYTGDSATITEAGAQKMGIFMSKNGSKLYVCSEATDRIYQYSMSTPWNLSSISYDSKFLAVNSQTTSPRGLFLSIDGTKAYVSDPIGHEILQYTLSTPWDISTGSYASKFLSIVSEETSVRNLQLSEDGTKLYITGTSSDKILQYTLSTPWDISTGSYDSKYIDISSYSSAPTALFLKPDGTKIYGSGSTENIIFQYSLNTPFNLNSSSDDNLNYTPSEITLPSGIFMKDDGEFLYILDFATSIYQYFLGEPQLNFTITAINNITSSPITGFNATINGTTYDDNNTGTITTPLLPNSTELFNITIEKYGYDDEVYLNYNVSSNLEASLYPDHTELTITATDYLGASILNFTANGISFNSTNISQAITTTGTATMWLKWNETYNVSVDAEGYANYLNYETVVMDNFTKAISIDDLFITNTINFTFKDEVSNALVTDVTVFLISDIFSDNYSTGSDSNLTVDMIQPADYEVQYTATGYAPRSFSFVLSDKSYNNFTLYMANYSTTSNITANVFDETGAKLPNALIEVLKYDYTTNSYKLVEQKVTNFNGITLLNLQKNTVYYKFRIKYKDIVRVTTNPTFIYQDSISFNVNTEDDAAEDFFNKEKVDYNLIFNQDTNNFRFEFSDTTNSLVTRGCVYVSREFNGIRTENYNSSCISSGSGTILVGIEEINGTSYVANAYVTIDGEDVFMASDSVYFGIKGNTGLLGLFLVVLLMITFAVMFSWNLVIAVLMFPTPLWLGSLTGLITLDLSVGLFMQAFAIIIAVVISKNS